MSHHAKEILLPPTLAVDWRWDNTLRDMTSQHLPCVLCPSSLSSKGHPLGEPLRWPSKEIPMLALEASFAVGGHQLVTSSVSDFTIVLITPRWETVMVGQGEDGNRKGQKGCFCTDEKWLPIPLVSQIYIKCRLREAGIVWLIFTLDKLLMTWTSPLPEACSLPTVPPPNHMPSCLLTTSLKARTRQTVCFHHSDQFLQMFICFDAHSWWCYNWGFFILSILSYNILIVCLLKTWFH